MASALLIVPPWLKYSAGPQLGPAMLLGAAQAAGHKAEFLDLNQRYLHDALPQDARAAAQPLFGDHGRDDALLRPVGEAFQALAAAQLPRYVGSPPPGDPVQTLLYDHAAVARAVRGLGDGPMGRWTARELAQQERPDLVGVSVLYSGQVLGGLLATLQARRLWPGVKVVWGGAHVTALRDEIAADPRYGFFIDSVEQRRAPIIDGFVFGYAERTFVALLDALARGAPWPAAVVRPGAGHAPLADDDADVAPLFQPAVAVPGERLVLPAQLSRGCAYGRCAFCTYPAVEGRYRELGPHGAEAVFALARARDAAVSFKDSLLVLPLLRRAAALSRGEVPWSACTKLTPGLDRAALAELAAGGCRTLEFGLETLSEDAQVLIDKRQSQRLFVDTLDALAEAGIGSVVNYITGFPGVNEEDEARRLAWLQAEVVARAGRLYVKIEHNRFQLERRAPLAARPPAGLTITGAWPWSTVLGWRYEATARSLGAGRRLPVHGSPML